MIARFNLLVDGALSLMTLASLSSRVQDQRHYNLYF